MDIQELADKQELTELVNKLFMYTDAQQWDELLNEVFVENVWIDMSSAGAGDPLMMPATAVCEMWQKGFIGLDAVHHQAGHYLIDVDADAATIFGYAVATHYKKSATKGKSRSFVGSYDLHASLTSIGWRLSQFKYNLKCIEGNINLE